MNDKHLGLGVMLKMLGGDEESAQAFTSCVGKVIKSIKLEDDILKFEFSDGVKLSISDEGQSCCEHRYMTCDDHFSDFEGTKLVGAELKDGPSSSDNYTDHDIQFLDINTDMGTFQLSSHNEHNGYYGGFSITCRVS